MPGSENANSTPPLLRLLFLDSGVVGSWSASAQDWRPVWTPHLGTAWHRKIGQQTNLFGFATALWSLDGNSGYFGLEPP